MYESCSSVSLLQLLCLRVFCFEFTSDHRGLHVLTHAFPTRRASYLALAVKDLIDAGAGSDRVGGDAVALGINGTATAQNDATVTNAMGAALAGNDIIL